MISEVSNEKARTGFSSLGAHGVRWLPNLLSPGIKGGNLNEPNLQDAYKPMER